jgi:drug/metabolite transporter (DMT)-like permease
VVLGLTSALVWGAADFGGGWTSRKTAVFGVVLVSQVAGLAIAVLIAILRREAFPGPADLGWSVLAGILGGIGITALYQALAVGTMSIVAPIIGVLAAIIPVIGGIVLEGWPPTLVLVGILVAIVAVVLVSRVADEGGGRAGLPEAIVAGVTIGLFGIVIAQITDGFVFGPMSVVRVTQAALVGILILVTRSAWRPGRRFLPILIVIGILDMAGNVAYLLAVQTGLLAVASVLSALYPVVTVLLAAVVLRERITRDHAIGIVLAGLAILCIGVGSA